MASVAQNVKENSKRVPWNNNNNNNNTEKASKQRKKFLKEIL